MELRQIRQFATLCDVLNFHRAAEALHMSQPPLSISMRKLEQELGVTLFERHARGVVLTEAGQSALPYARRVLNAADGMRDAATMAAHGMAGRLNVGFVGSVVYALLPRVVPLFRTQRPAIELRLREVTTLDILRGLESGDLDVGVLRTPIIDPGDARIEPLYREEMILLLPRGHALEGRATIRLDELRDEPFIGYDRARLPNYRHLSLSACDAAGFQPRIVEEAAQLHTLIALVESGIGVALAPAVSRVPGADRVAYARLTVAGQPILIGLALATRPGDDRPACGAFVTALREAAAHVVQAEPVWFGE